MHSGSRSGISAASSPSVAAQRALDDGEAMPGARWLPDARLNYAENLLRRAGDGQPTIDAGVSNREG